MQLVTPPPFARTILLALASTVLGTPARADPIFVGTIAGHISITLGERRPVGGGFETGYRVNVPRAMDQRNPVGWIVGSTLRVDAGRREPVQNGIFFQTGP